MNKDKVYLKGYVIGRAADTLGYEGLVVQLENLDVVEIDKNLVHKDINEPQLLKLKDIIARIKGFDSGTRKVWLDGILGELGSEYGSLKYKQGYDQGKFEGSLIPYEEPQKPVVSQFVADWYEEHKDNLEYNIWDWTKYNLEPKKRENVIFSRWLGKTVNNPVETLIKMKLYGYEVEKEKRYYIRFKFIEDSYSYLTLIKHLNAWTLTEIKKDKKFRTEHTKKQLEEAGFGWVFDCEGIEIEEVEE